ncbi:hypothetical protein IAQ61_004558 [Plenodomus lingam]|nr:hypothetical protein IAQ61_004558 [Plenodomus lingam]
MSFRLDTDETDYNNVIAKSFFASRPWWYDEPVINSWATDQSVHKVLHHVNNLYQQWRRQPEGPFSPFSDSLWAETANVQRDAGLPWHNNNLNLPEEIDKSWPFHFKEFERHVVLAKGARVDDFDAAGYICNSIEANQYGIRAIQQELRRQMPNSQPLLVAGCIELSVSESASHLFGLELLQLDRPWKHARGLLEERSRPNRPMIVIASLGNGHGEMDDFEAISELAKQLPIYLHVDASRTFDYLTTMSTADRKRLALPRLVLQHPFEDVKSYDDAEPTIVAATIVGAGTNSISPPPAVVLKPRTLGTPSEMTVEYVRGTDSTLAGSRDALGPLLMYLQELRFGSTGIREVYRRCMSNREMLQEVLQHCEIKADAPSGSLDLIIECPTRLCESTRTEFGLRQLTKSSYLATVQPSATIHDALKLGSVLSGLKLSVNVQCWIPTLQDEFPVAKEITATIKSAVDHFRVVGKTSGGYPLNQAPYSALGPIIGHFLALNIPRIWTDARAKEILSARKSSFGLTPSEHGSFPGCFTTGSTMGNRVGIHTALSQHPDAYIYYSSATHYSVKKVIRDSDYVTSIWREDKRPRFAEIPVDEYGCMQIPRLVQQVVRDRDHCTIRGNKHEVILFANIGTTFIGGRDEIKGIRSALRTIGAEVDYIHVDGALDLGFAPDSVSLGPPGLDSRDGLPVVQGLTISHHKAYGIMVSGEVICYSPHTSALPTATPVDSRIIFETWLFQQLYHPEALVATRDYCLANATRLRGSLAALGLETRYNKDCIITVLERIPPWLIRSFHLAPEGDWLHFIAMPHIHPSAVAAFAAALLRVSMHFTAMFNALQAPLSKALGCAIRIKRVRVHDEAIFRDVAEMAGREQRARQQQWDVAAFKRRYVYSTMSFAALSDSDQLLVVFLAEADADKRITPGPVLVQEGQTVNRPLLKEIGLYGFEFLARRLELYGCAAQDIL